LNRNLCYELLTAAYQMTDGFHGLSEREGELVYDCKACMYTSIPIEMPFPDMVSLSLRFYLWQSH
jgi:hypothetical protein